MRGGEGHALVHRRMSILELFAGGGGLLLLALSLVEIAPIRVNPWSAAARWLGSIVNRDVLDRLDEISRVQRDTQQRLDAHIRVDDERAADMHRAKILRFNNELLRDIPHTREEFIEILAEIDGYEAFCRAHPDYQNNRAIHAIANIGRTYDERLQKHDFL